MTVRHDGTRVPVLKDRWDTDGTEWVSVGWADVVALHGALTSSSWDVPTGVTVEETRENVTVTDTDGTDHNYANQARLTVADTVADAVITNRVAFADGTQLDRSGRIFTADL